jgi:hypothetical protein
VGCVGDRGGFGMFTLPSGSGSYKSSDEGELLEIHFEGT